MKMEPPTPRQVDTQVGEIRVVINDVGLIGLYRGDSEHLVLVRGEALAIARLLLEHLGRPNAEDVPAHDGFRLGGRK